MCCNNYYLLKSLKTFLLYVDDEIQSENRSIIFQLIVTDNVVFGAIFSTYVLYSKIIRIISHAKVVNIFLLLLRGSAIIIHQYSPPPQ